MIRTATAEELEAMRAAYVDVMGEEFDGGAMTEEDFWNLVRLGDNVFARRRIADHHLAEGDVFEAGSELLCAAERGDRESIRRLVTGREFVDHVDTSLNVAALLNLVFLDDSGLAGFVEGLGRECPVAADNILMWSWTWNRDPERYSEWVGTCLSNGSARARFTEAWNMLSPGFTGGSVDRPDEALELMSDAAGTFWRASMHMAISTTSAGMRRGTRSPHAGTSRTHADLPRTTYPRCGGGFSSATGPKTAIFRWSRRSIWMTSRNGQSSRT